MRFHVAGQTWGIVAAENLCVTSLIGEPSGVSPVQPRVWADAWKRHSYQGTVLIRAIFGIHPAYLRIRMQIKLCICQDYLLSRHLSRLLQI